MDSDTSVSSSSSSYREEYWHLKNLYDGVLDSNSQMVLRLEETKLILFENTKQLQSQNSALMSENMHLRAQKEYLLQEFEKLRTLVENVLQEVGNQRSSMERQEGCVRELLNQVESVAENKGNDLQNPDLKAKIEKEKNSISNPTALHELDKQHRASNSRPYYLPTIVEEHCGDHNEKDGGLMADDGNDFVTDDDVFNTTRTIIHQSAPSGSIHEAHQEIVQPQGNFNSAAPTSKIGKRKFIGRTRKGAEKGACHFEFRKNNEGQYPEFEGSLQFAENLENEPHENPHPTAIPQSELGSAELHFDGNNLMVVCVEPSSDCNNHEMVRMEPSSSAEEEPKYSRHSNAQEVMVNREKIEDNETPISEVSGMFNVPETSSWDNDSDHPKNPEMLAPEADGDALQAVANRMRRPQQVPDDVIVSKKVAESCRAREPQFKYPVRKGDAGRNASSEYECILSNTKSQLKCILKKTSSRPKSLHERVQLSPQNDIVALHQNETVALHQNVNLLSTPSSDGALKVNGWRIQLSGKEKPTNESPRPSSTTLNSESNAHVKPKEGVTKRFLDCRGNEKNGSPQTRTTLSEGPVETSVSVKIQTEEAVMGIPYKPNETAMETSSSGKKRTTRRKTQNRQINDATIVETQHTVLTRKSITKNTLAAERDVFSNRVSSVDNEQDENSYGKTISGLSNEKSSERKPRSTLSITASNLELPTSRILRQSQIAIVAGQPDSQRSSVASNQGESCNSDVGTPKARRRRRATEIKKLDVDSDVALWDLTSGQRVTRSRSKQRRNLEI